METVQSYYNSIKIRDLANENIKLIRDKGCLCQNGYELESTFCSSRFKSTRCYGCGATYATRDCAHNQFSYSCPECGESMT